MVSKTRDYFYLREVILGLRKEYLENEKKLEDLKKYLVLDGKNDDTSLFINRINNNYYLAIYLKKRQSFLMNSLKKINNLLTGKVEENEVMIYKGFGDRNSYICSNDLKNVKYKDFNAFCSDGDHLLFNEFNTELVDSYFKIDSENLEIKVGHQGVFVLTNDDKYCSPKTGVDYHADEDQLVVTSYYKTSTPNGIQRVLESHIPYSVIGKNSFDIINNNPEKDMPVVFDGYTYDNYSSQYFKFEKDNNVMKLKRVK